MEPFEIRFQLPLMISSASSSNAEFHSRASELKSRTKQFAPRVIRLVDALPKSRAADVLGKQLLRSGTSVGANYRAACRARSSAEFRAKMGIVEEESDESAYWMELLIDANLVKPKRMESLLQEAHEITAIAVASINTSRKRTR
jgi:four helix bundle protein